MMRLACASMRFRQIKETLALRSPYWALMALEVLMLRKPPPCGVTQSRGVPVAALSIPWAGTTGGASAVDQRDGPPKTALSSPDLAGRTRPCARGKRARPAEEQVLVLVPLSSLWPPE